MARVTAGLAFLAFAAGCATFLQGLRAGHGEGALTTHLYWGFATLALQLFAAAVAWVHARASAIDAAENRPPGPPR
jgi:hypothetical protein